MKSINEMIGSIDSASNSRFHLPKPTDTEYTTYSSAAGPVISNIPQTKNCSKMYPWQQGITKSLRTHDVYVPASPGGGKTLPYMCYWSSEILKINTIYGDQSFDKLHDTFIKLLTAPEQLDKLLVLVPIRQLADQTTQEFFEFFGAMIGEFLRTMISDPDFVGNLNSQKYRTVYNMISSDFNQLIQNRFLLYRRIELSKNNENRRVSPQELRTMENTINGTDSIIQNRIEGFIKGFKDNKGFRNRPSLVAERTGAVKTGDLNQAPVIIAIYQSAPALLDQFKDKLKMVVCDESHKIQQSSLDPTSTSKDIAYSLYSILKRVKQTTRLCFLSGTINPTSANLLAVYLKTCFKRNISVVDVPSSAKNQSNISVHIDDSIKSDRELIRIIKNKQSYNNLIVLFSKARIDKIAAAVVSTSTMQTASNIEGNFHGRYRPQKIQARGMGNVSKNPNINYQKTGLSAVSGDMDIAQIHDSTLRACAYAGFGYLYRMDENLGDKQKRGKDNQIIAQLFKDKKIRTLLATDAIGVGVNIDVKTLFIPSIEKFTGQRVERLATAELAQLLHRTGRGAFKFSRVITTEGSYPSVVNALSVETDKFTQVDVVEKFPISLCHAKEAFMTVYQGLNKKRR